jgi:PAS domain S-box-containing protein
LGAPFLEGEYARLIDKANAPIFGIDVSGRVNVWNQKASQVTGFTAEGVMGRNLVREFITQDYQESVEEVRERASERARETRRATDSSRRAPL